MKIQAAWCFFAASTSLCSLAQAQGLLAIGRQTDYQENIPLTFNVSVHGGYDSIGYGGQDDVESYFIQSGAGVTYSDNGGPTRWNLGADASVIHYLDDAERGEDMDYSAKLAFNVSHEFSRRLQVSNNFYLTYEVEPDYGVGVTTGRRAGQYLFGYNNTSVAYAWSERVATTTGYTVDGIVYTDDDQVSDSEDRTSHLFSQQVSYALSRTTKLVAEYRFRLTKYANEVDTDLPDRDYKSHYILVGVDQAWSERLSGSLRGGAEIYQSDREDKTSPSVEGALNYALSARSSLRWYVQAGFDGSELGQYDSRYSYRSGVQANHQFTQRLSGHAGLHYVHSEFEGNDRIESSSENELNASLGFSYNFWNNLSLDGTYSFTTISSDSSFREYDRHRLNLGLNAVF